MGAELASISIGVEAPPSTSHMGLGDNGYENIEVFDAVPILVSEPEPMPTSDEMPMPTSEGLEIWNC